MYNVGINVSLGWTIECKLRLPHVHETEDIMERVGTIHELVSLVFAFQPLQYTVKPAYVVTSIKQSPLFKGHHLLSCHRKFHMN